MNDSEERYRRDSEFKYMVDMIHNGITRNQWTAGDVREAAMLAAIHYEMHHVRAFGTLPDPLDPLRRPRTTPSA